MFDKILGNLKGNMKDLKLQMTTNKGTKYELKKSNPTPTGDKPMVPPMQQQSVPQPMPQPRQPAPPMRKVALAPNPLSPRGVPMMNRGGMVPPMYLNKGSPPAIETAPAIGKVPPMNKGIPVSEGVPPNAVASAQPATFTGDPTASQWYDLDLLTLQDLLNDFRPTDPEYAEIQAVIAHKTQQGGNEAGTEVIDGNTVVTTDKGLELGKADATIAELEAHIASLQSGRAAAETAGQRTRVVQFDEAIAKYTAQLEAAKATKTDIESDGDSQITGEKGEVRVIVGSAEDLALKDDPRYTRKVLGNTAIYSLVKTDGGEGDDLDVDEPAVTPEDDDPADPETGVFETKDGLLYKDGKLFTGVHQGSTYKDGKAVPLPTKEEQKTFFDEAAGLFGLTGNDAKQMLLYYILGIATGGTSSGSFKAAADHIMKGKTRREDRFNKQTDRFNEFLFQNGSKYSKEDIATAKKFVANGEFSKAWDHLSGKQLVEPGKPVDVTKDRNKAVDDWTDMAKNIFPGGPDSPAGFQFPDGSVLTNRELASQYSVWLDKTVGPNAASDPAFWNDPKLVSAFGHALRDASKDENFNGNLDPYFESRFIQTKAELGNEFVTMTTEDRAGIISQAESAAATHNSGLGEDASADDQQTSYSLLAAIDNDWNSLPHLKKAAGENASATYYVFTHHMLGMTTEQKQKYVAKIQAAGDKINVADLTTYATQIKGG